MSRSYIGPSDAQANAEALARRETPYTAAFDMSVRVAWDWHRREPTDLREAVRMVRRAYSDEVPAKLHEGSECIGPDGTPKMTTRAEGYIFGLPQASDKSDFYRSPFRAMLDHMEHGDEANRKRAAIVAHVAIRGQGPQEAAIAEAVPTWCAKIVAEDALRSFLAHLTDLKLEIAKA